MTQRHRVIWLQPWCDGCEKHATSPESGRAWCQDNPWDDCECGEKAVRYVLADADVSKDWSDCEE